MYCKDEVFTESIDFGDNAFSWQTISEQICTMSKNKHQSFIDTILCNAYMRKKDPQIENILGQYKLRQENPKIKEIREKCEQKLLHSEKRKMNFPMYNMQLNRQQYASLFHGRKLKHTLLGRKRKSGSASRIRMGFGSRAGLSVRKMAVPESAKKEALAELKEDDELSRNSSGGSAISRADSTASAARMRQTAKADTDRNSQGKADDQGMKINIKKPKAKNLSNNFNFGKKEERSDDLSPIFRCPMLNENSSEMTTDSMLFNNIFEKFERKLTLEQEIAN